MARLTRARRGLAAWLARPLGFELIRDDMYSPVPELPAGEEGWELRSALAGVDWDLDRQLAFVRDELGPWLGELEGFDLDNRFYTHGDAELLHAVLRWSRPARMLEIGAGFSTQVSTGALARNAAEGHPCEHVVVDPEPRVEPPAGTHLERLRAQDVPATRFDALQAGDVLFVDTTHTVKRGSDVVHLVLEVLPRLAPGVLVHLHDVFLPYDYPREWYERGTFPSEQWLVQALLSGSAAFEVLAAAHALTRERDLQALIPSLAQRGVGPAALWLRRSAPAA
jgi:predicted O-methyltransferase YrrM